MGKIPILIYPLQHDMFINHFVCVHGENILHASRCACTPFAHLRAHVKWRMHLGSVIFFFFFKKNCIPTMFFSLCIASRKRGRCQVMLSPASPSSRRSQKPRGPPRRCRPPRGTPAGCFPASSPPRRNWPCAAAAAPSAPRLPAGTLKEEKRDEKTLNWKMGLKKNNEQRQRIHQGN